MRVLRYGRKKAIDTALDPYLNKVNPADKAFCTRCGAVYHNKRWSLEEVKKPLAAEKGAHAEVLCPACQKIRDGFVGGFVTLKGDFVKAHSDEIKNLIHNKEKRIMSYNPLERIIALRETDDGMEVTTTTEKFAQRLGAMLKKAYKGDVEYKWSADVKLARVIWSRNE